MKIALAQINAWLGDFSGNAQKILLSCERAHQEKCDLVVFPEAALFGYHPCDLLERKTIVDEQLIELKKLHKSIPKGIGVVVGAFGHNKNREGKPFRNSAVFLERGKKAQWFSKQLLPTYDVFDESRHIEPGQMKKNVLRWRGKKILVTICEDIWAWPHKGKSRSASYLKNPIKDVARPINFVINLSASPFTESKLNNRRRVVKETAKYFRSPMVYVNMVGAQDELLFDGASFAIDSKGKILAQCQRFEEDFVVVDLAKKSKYKDELINELEVKRRALVMGLRDFARKNGFQKFHLGLSGGIDSAVVACLAVDAVGKDNVTAIGLPGPYSAPESLSLAKELANRLGLNWRTIDINGAYKSIVNLFEASEGAKSFGLMNENIQARLRGLLLMAYANRERSLLLATSNKSELCTGFSTLYGDMNGALMPIGDLLKSDVYAIAGLYNIDHEVIPRAIIERPPTAELRPNQKDEDSLPAYEILDPAVEKLVEGYLPAQTTDEKDVLRLMMQSEFKRWQAAPILKVTDHAFGRGRRFPLSHKAFY